MWQLVCVLGAYACSAASVVCCCCVCCWFDVVMEVVVMCVHVYTIFVVELLTSVPLPLSSCDVTM